MAKYVTQSEAARRLGVHPNTIGTMLRDGRLEAVIVGNGSGSNQSMRRVDERSLILAEAKRALGSPAKTVDELLREERVKVLTELADELDAMRDNAPVGSRDTSALLGKLVLKSLPSTVANKPPRRKTNE